MLIAVIGNVVIGGGVVIMDELYWRELEERRNALYLVFMLIYAQRFWLTFVNLDNGMRF